MRAPPPVSNLPMMFAWNSDGVKKQLTAEALQRANAIAISNIINSEYIAGISTTSKETYPYNYAWGEKNERGVEGGCISVYFHFMFYWIFACDYILIIWIAILLRFLYVYMSIFAYYIHL